MFRSFIAAVSAAVLLPGVLATAGVASADAPAGDGSAEVTTLYPALLTRGADTPLLHTEKSTIVDGRLRIAVPGVVHLWLLGRVGDDYLLETADDGFVHYTVLLVRPDGTRRVLQRFDDKTTPVASSDGRRLALVTLERTDTRIRVVKTRSGELVTQRRFGSYGVEVADYGLRRMVLTGLRSRTYWWNPETRSLSLLVPRPADADIRANRLVVSIPDPTDPLAECQKTVVLSDPSVVLWRSCQDRPLAFSPDGTRMATIYIGTDGIGPRLLQIRGERGRLLRTLRAPMFFGFVEWESNHRLLVQPVGKRYVAAVRCRAQGECVRASRLYPSPGTYDPLVAMEWSFL